MSGTAERPGAAPAPSPLTPAAPSADAPAAPSAPALTPAAPAPSADAPSAPSVPSAPARAARRIRLPAQLPARCLAVALALAACDAPEAVRHSLGAQVALLVVAGVAWWAAPMVDERPVRNSMRWAKVAARRRSTVLAVGSVVAAAVTEPPTWLAACVAGLFLAYLLITDDWTRGATAPRAARGPAPARTAAAAVALTFVCATVPVAGTDWARLPAALALAATVGCVALAVRGRRGPR
ncbi:hypothetical protein ACFZAM_11975 [Streptomyces sp. NPDC008079]|uniref:hypothetical protein n=1 Tax=Streptomyces sp. NPDC008079 TaxID=3364806 RepID=UPI0036F1769B